MYKQSFIGVLWAFIIPIISIGTFLILSSSGVFSIGNIDVPYPIYALLGMAFWQIFAVGLVSSSNSLVKAGAMIIRINFSKKALVIASLGQSLIPFFIQFFFVVILLFIYKITETHSHFSSLFLCFSLPSYMPNLLKEYSLQSHDSILCFI
jgi:lipopolysaccharide transport system permease protein